MSLPYHTIFVVIAAAFFLFRFWCEPKAYRLVLAVWAPCTMMGYLVDAAWWSYLSLGVQVAFLIAFVLLKLWDKHRTEEAKFTQDAQNRTIKEELGQVHSKLP